MDFSLKLDSVLGSKGPTSRMAHGKSMPRLSATSLGGAFFTVLISIVVVVDGCVLMKLNDFEPISVEKRTALADVIISGTVLRVLRHQRSWDSTYPADVLVADVYKGYELFDNATSLSEDEIQAEYRSYYPHVYRIDRFGDQRLCWADVVPGRNYVFYLTTNPSPRDLEMASDGGEVVDMSMVMTKEGIKLEASHDAVSGASIEYDVKTEENILNILGMYYSFYLSSDCYSSLNMRCHLNNICFDYHRSTTCYWFGINIDMSQDKETLCRHGFN